MVCMAAHSRVVSAFLGRWKAGGKPGYPRFKPASRFRTIECFEPPRPWERADDRTVLRIKGLPRITIKPDWELPSLKPKFVRVTRADAGLNVDLVLDGVHKQPQAPSPSAAGIDLGAKDQLALSDGERIRGVADSDGNNTTRKRSRAVSRCQRGSGTRGERVRQPSINNMARSATGTADEPEPNVKRKSGLNRSVPRQCRGLLTGQLASKAEWVGRRFEQIDPAYTSQRCHRTSQRCHRCSVADRSNCKGQRYACKRRGYSGDAVVSAAIDALQALSPPGPASILRAGGCPAESRLSQRRLSARSE